MLVVDEYLVAVFRRLLRIEQDHREPVLPDAIHERLLERTREYDRVHLLLADHAGQFILPGLRDEKQNQIVAVHRGFGFDAFEHARIKGIDGKRLGLPAENEPDIARDPAFQALAESAGREVMAPGQFPDALFRVLPDIRPVVQGF